MSNKSWGIGPGVAPKAFVVTDGDDGATALFMLRQPTGNEHARMRKLMSKQKGKKITIDTFEAYTEMVPRLIMEVCPPGAVAPGGIKVDGICFVDEGGSETDLSKLPIDKAKNFLKEYAPQILGSLGQEIFFAVAEEAEEDLENSEATSPDGSGEMLSHVIPETSIPPVTGMGSPPTEPA